MSNNVFKFKPSGANTVPLGERRPFSQNVPEHISNVYTQTQNDGQSTDSRLLAGGSCWDDLSKGTRGRYTLVLLEGEGPYTNVCISSFNPLFFIIFGSFMKFWAEA